MPPPTAAAAIAAGYQLLAEFTAQNQQKAGTFSEGFTAAELD